MIAHQKMSAQWLKFHIGVNFKVNWNVGTHNYLKDYKQHWKVSVCFQLVFSQNYPHTRHNAFLQQKLSTACNSS